MLYQLSYSRISEGHPQYCPEFFCLQGRCITLMLEGHLLAEARIELADLRLMRPLSLAVAPSPRVPLAGVEPAKPSF